MRHHTDITKRLRSLRDGFTLLEIILALFVLSLLVGSVFAIVNGTLQLTTEMSQVQQGEARLHGLHRLCDKLFTGLPAYGQVRLRTKQNGSRYLSQLAIRHAPQIFGLERRTGRGLTLLETEETPDGYLRLVMRWFNEDEMTTWEKGQKESGKNSLVLMENISDLNWGFYDPISKQWEPVLNENQNFEPILIGNGNKAPVLPTGWKRPSLVELQVTTAAGEKIRHVFWVPRLDGYEARKG